jgi:hypothetical protein
MKVFQSSNLADYKNNSCYIISLQEIGLKVARNRLAITAFNKNANHCIPRE